MINRTFARTIALLVLATLGGIPMQALGGGYSDYHRHYFARYFLAELNGYNEIPSISTPATGRFKAKLDRDSGSIEFELSYENLTDRFCDARIHFGQEHTDGGEIVWLCATKDGCPGQPPEDLVVVDCPEDGEPLTGTITEDDVVTQAKQGIQAGEFDKLVAAMKAGATYVNLHTDENAGGLIRGQVEITSKRRYRFSHW